MPIALTSADGWDTTAWKSLSVGESHACAIRLSDDRLFCWGTGTNGQLGSGDTIATNLLPRPLASSGDWSERAWEMVSAGQYHTMAIEADPNACSSSIASQHVQANDLIVGMAHESGRLRLGKKSTFMAQEGLLAYSRLDKTMMVCDGQVWKKIVKSTGATCSNYPDPLSRVIEWLSDVSGRAFLSTQTKRGTPREGSLIYNSSAKRLEVCDGTNWQVLSP